MLNPSLCGRVVSHVAIDRFRRLLFCNAGFNRFGGNRAWAFACCISCSVDLVYRRLKRFGGLESFMEVQRYRKVQPLRVLFGLLKQGKRSLSPKTGSPRHSSIPLVPLFSITPCSMVCQPASPASFDDSLSYAQSVLVFVHDILHSCNGIEAVRAVG